MDILDNVLTKHGVNELFSSKLNRKVNYRINSSYVYNENDFEISEYKAYSKYLVIDNGCALENYTLNFQVVDNKYKTILINNKFEKDNNILACELNLSHHAYMGITRDERCKIYTNDGEILVVTNVGNKQVKIDNDDCWSEELIYYRKLKIIKCKKDLITVFKNRKLKIVE